MNKLQKNIFGKVYAFILGNGGYNEIGLIRSCGESGMNVIILCPSDIVIPIYKSRYVTQWIATDDYTAIDLRNIILRILKDEPESRAVIFPATDKAVSMIDENYALLSQVAIVPNAKGNILRIMDKWEMVRLANKCNITVPASFRYNIIENDPEIIIPCIIKPLRSTNGDKADITICRNAESFKSTIDHYRSKGTYDILVQQLINGRNQEEIAVTGVSTQNGKVFIPGVVHKLRIRGNGSTVFAKFKADIDDCLIKNIADFIHQTGYTGIFDIEFLKNDDGIFFIECNFRNGAYGYAITSAGFNMPLCFLLESIDKEYQIQNIRDLTFMEERSDFLNVLEHKLTLWLWIKNLFQTDTFLWMNWKDLRPLVRIPFILKRFFRLSV